MLVLASLASSAEPEPPSVKEISPSPAGEKEKASSPSPTALAPIGKDEAIARGRLLHLALHGALQVMHRDFFRRGESKTIPSESLVDVFKEMENDFSVALRWLAPDETIMNEDHAPQDDFDRRALKALAAGEKEFVSEEKGMLRFAGPVVLHNDCLKCHVPNRKSLENRFSALSISIPVIKSPSAVRKP